MPTDRDDKSGILNTLKDAARWWLGDGALGDAADDVDSRNRKKQIKCIQNGGTWDNERKKCIMPGSG
jgi:hypothetical protein